MASRSFSLNWIKVLNSSDLVRKARLSMCTTDWSEKGREKVNAYLGFKLFFRRVFISKPQLEFHSIHFKSSRLWNIQIVLLPISWPCDCNFSIHFSVSLNVLPPRALPFSTFSGFRYKLNNFFRVQTTF